jgi:hypothetical protein
MPPERPDDAWRDPALLPDIRDHAALAAFI